MLSIGQKDKRGILFALVGFSLFSCGDMMIKLLGDSGFEPPEIAFFLQLFFLPLLLVLSPWIGGIKATLRTDNFWLQVFRALGGVLIFYMMINGFKQLGMAMSYTLIFVGPFFATLLSALILKDRVGMFRWFSLAAPFHYVQLLWGTLFGIVIFYTVPDRWTALGASIIVMSGLLLIYREHVRHRELTTGVTAHGGFGQD